MRRTFIALLIGVLAGSAISVASAGAAPFARTGHRPDTIVKVVGTMTDGFRVTHHDGTRVGYPPIRAALRECLDGLDSEGQIAYERCRTAVRVEYTWIGNVKRSLRYAYNH